MSLNVGIIGMGIGEKHSIAFESHEKCFVKTLCDFDAERLRLMAKKYPDKFTTEKAKDIINDQGIDIVSVASYDNYHAEQIVQSIENKKHVLTEKPLCLFNEEMEQIRDVLNKNSNIKLSSNLVLRTNPRFQKIRKQIKNGNLGKVYYLEGDYYWGRIHKLNGWRSRMEFYSIIHGAAIHMIDLVMWLTGERPVEVQAMGNNLATSNSPLKFNSFAVLLLKFNSGIIAKITGNSGCVYPHFHALKVFGTNQTAIHDLLGGLWVDSSEMATKPRPMEEPYPAKEFRKEVINSFVDNILDKTKTPLVSQKDVFDVMSVCFAAEEAMQRGKKTTIVYLD